MAAALWRDRLASSDAFDVALGGILGQHPPAFGEMSLKQLREICVKHGHSDLVERCDLAEQLITAARCLFDRPVSMDDPIAPCRTAARMLKMAVGKDGRLQQ